MSTASAVAAFRFILELCALAALAYWGFLAGRGTIMTTVLAIGAPLLAALVWGTFIAPRAWLPVPIPLRLALELGIFGLAALGLAAAGQPALAGIFVLAVVVNFVLRHFWGRP